jgi:hypothetical protein
MSKMAAPQGIGTKEGFGGGCAVYTCVWTPVVLFVCSSTVVQYNSVTGPLFRQCIV